MVNEDLYILKCERKFKMGGGGYSRSVGSSSTKSTSRLGGSMSSGMASSKLSGSSLHKDLDPLKRTIKCESSSPILIWLDVTGSNIEFAKVTYDKAPMFYGQIEIQKYLDDFTLSVSAVGDAHSDSVPVQAAPFEKGLKVDEQLEKLYLEGGGGGQKQESYELAAYYTLMHCDISEANVPFCFFIADEYPYFQIDPQQVQEHIGDTDVGTLDSKEVFTELLDKFKGNVFVILNEYFGGGNKGANKMIYEGWCQVLPSEHIIRVTEEKSVIDLIRGIIAMVSKARTLEEYQDDLANLTDPDTGKLEPQTPERIANVGTDLSGLSKSLVVMTDTSGSLPPATSDEKKSGSERF